MQTKFIDATYDLGALSATSNDACLVVLSHQDKKLQPAGDHFNKQYGEILDKAMKASTFKGKKGQVLCVTIPNALFGRLAILGCGDAKDLKVQDYVDIGGDLFAALDGTPLSNVSIIFEPSAVASVPPATAAANVAEGFCLRSYRFDKYKSKKNEEEAKTDVTSLVIATPNAF